MAVAEVKKEVAIVSNEVRDRKEYVGSHWYISDPNGGSEVGIMGSIVQENELGLEAFSGHQQASSMYGSDASG